MQEDAVFRREGALFVPSAYASGPWSPDRLHGGPVFGLLTRAVEEVAGDGALRATRLSFDLSRGVPLSPLSLRTQLLRQSARLCVVQAGLCSGEQEYARVTALLLRPEADGSGHVAHSHAPRPPAGPEGLPTETLMRSGSLRMRSVRPGFHTRVETRWPPRAPDEPLSVWFRLPIALVAGESASPLQLAAAMADFANAVANIAQREREGQTGAHINVDATLYLTRAPSGEWIGLQELSYAVDGGVSVAVNQLFDAQGAFGTVQQSRLAQRMPPARGA